MTLSLSIVAVTVIIIVTVKSSSIVDVVFVNCCCYCNYYRYSQSVAVTVNIIVTVKSSSIVDVVVVWLQDFFPVNFLRNVALENAETKYVFLTDIDFEPMPKLDIRLQDYILKGYLQGKTVCVCAIIALSMQRNLMLFKVF